MSYKPKFSSGNSPKKRFNPLVLILCAVAVLALIALAVLLLNTGGGEGPTFQAEETTVPVFTTEVPTTATPTTEPTTVPTTEPIVYFNPLNGTILDAPYSGRIFATTMANENDAALPHVNSLLADIIIETFANNNKTRCLAMFSDPTNITAVGSIRSTRLMFNDIAQHYGLILSHGGGSDVCIGDANDRGIHHYNVDSLMRQSGAINQGTAYRDKDHPRQKYGDANLYAILPGVKALAESEGVQTEGLPETDYGMTFLEDGTPVSGEYADEITIHMVVNQAKKGSSPTVSRKDSIMVYDRDLGKYVWHQYGKEMTELFTGEKEAFTNVVVMFYTPFEHTRYHGTIYYDADFVQGGTGYYACGGKIIPITWTCDSETSPFRFFHEDGTPLSFGQGNTYINLAPVMPDYPSTVEWTGTAPVETEPAAETTPATEAA